jgi:hypothetical protein
MTGFSIENKVDLEDGQNLYRIKDTVVAEFQRRGFTIPSAPIVSGPDGRPAAYQGEIPPDLTILSDQHLGQYLSLLSGWLAFTGIQMAMAQMENTIAKSQLEFAEATIRLSYKYDEDHKKRTVQERDDMVHCDRRYIEAHKTFIYLDSFCTLVELVHKSAEQNYNAVSRRITQRGQEIDRGGRNNNVGNSMNSPLMPRRPG